MAKVLAPYVGNPVDIMKQAVLFKLCHSMTTQLSPWTYVDVFPAPGKQRVLNSSHMQSLLDFQDFTDKIGTANDFMEYAEYLKEFNEIDTSLSLAEQKQRLCFFPSGVDIARKFMTEDDRGMLLQTNPYASEHIKNNIPDSRFKCYGDVLNENESLHAHIESFVDRVPLFKPTTARGLVNIDLGNDILNDMNLSASIGDIAGRFCREWPTAVKILSFPLNRKPAIDLMRRVVREGQNNMLGVQVLLNKHTYSGVGMVVINAPAHFIYDIRNTVDQFGLLYLDRPLLKPKSEAAIDFINKRETYEASLVKRRKLTQKRKRRQYMNNSIQGIPQAHSAAELYVSTVDEEQVIPDNERNLSVDDKKFTSILANIDSATLESKDENVLREYLVAFTQLKSHEIESLINHAYDIAMLDIDHSIWSLEQPEDGLSGRDIPFDEVIQNDIKDIFGNDEEAKFLAENNAVYAKSYDIIYNHLQEERKGGKIDFGSKDAILKTADAMYKEYLRCLPMEFFPKTFDSQLCAKLAVLDEEANKTQVPSMGVNDDGTVDLAMNDINIEDNDDDPYPPEYYNIRVKDILGSFNEDHIAIADKLMPAALTRSAYVEWLSYRGRRRETDLLNGLLDREAGRIFRDEAGTKLSDETLKSIGNKPKTSVKIAPEFLNFELGLPRRDWFPEESVALPVPATSTQSYFEYLEQEVDDAGSREHELREACEFLDAFGRSRKGL